GFGGLGAVEGGSVECGLVEIELDRPAGIVKRLDADAVRMLPVTVALVGVPGGEKAQRVAGHGVSRSSRCRASAARSAKKRAPATIRLRRMGEGTTGPDRHEGDALFAAAADERGGSRAFAAARISRRARWRSWPG